MILAALRACEALDLNRCGMWRIMQVSEIASGGCGHARGGLAMLAVALGGCLLWSELVALLTLSQAHPSYADSRYLRGYKKKGCVAQQHSATTQYRGRGLGCPDWQGEQNRSKVDFYIKTTIW